MLSFIEFILPERHTEAPGTECYHIQTFLFLIAMAGKTEGSICEFAWNCGTG